MPPIRLALCLEYPLALRGGVSVLIEELIGGLGEQYEIVLFSPDTAAELALHPLAQRLKDHVQVSSEISRASSQRVADEMVKRRIHLAHFHLGGTYSWGARFPGQSPFGMLARAGVAVCSTVHWVLPLFEGYCGPQKPFWFKLALFPICWSSKLMALRRLQAEVAVSKHDESRLRHRFWPMASRFRQIYHSRLDSASTGIPLSRQRDKVILNVGHLAPRKGQHLLFAAFREVARRYPEWELHLAGPFVDEPYAAALADAAERAGLSDRVRLLGSRSDANELMAHAAIYVQPSTGEALGLALQEALAAGCACIGARAGGIPELITAEENGLLVQAGDASRLAEGLARLLHDEPLRARLSAAGPESIRSRNMSAAEMIAQHDRLYRRMLNPDGLRTPRAGRGEA